MGDQVVRVWRGYGSEAGVNRYWREHFATSVLPRLRSIEGFVDASVLIRLAKGETEVVVATQWDSIESIRAFAGDDYEHAVVDPAVGELLHRFDDRATHFVVALSTRERHEPRKRITDRRQVES